LQLADDDGIVVREVRKDGAMAPQRYGVALRERLGNDGYEALEAMMEDKQKELLTVDRFERRMTEEGAVRREEIAAVRLEIAGVRHDLSQRDAALRHEWMLVFWVGHTFTVAGLVAAMLRFIRP
jgi:hypothetical protein